MSYASAYELSYSKSFTSKQIEKILKKKKKKKKQKSGSLLKQPFFFTIRTRVAVTYSFATCSSIMQIHMHERCTYNSLSLARVANAWRFAGSICQLAEKTDEIKWKNEREKNRTSWRKGQIETSNKGRLRKEGRERERKNHQRRRQI